MRWREINPVALAGAGIVLDIVVALAANAATSTDRWPGPLDLLRQHPWLSTGLFGLLWIAVVGLVAWNPRTSTAVAGDPPPPPPEPVPDWVVDRHSHVQDVVKAVCGEKRAVGITTSLWGAGGFGKTTLAKVVCADRRVRRRFKNRVYTVTIGRDVRSRAEIAAKVTEVTRFVTGDTTEHNDPDLAGAHLGRLLDQRPRTLLLLDDVWEAAQLRPFLLGGRRCVRLVTTRHPGLLTSDAATVRVDAMSKAQARAVLTWELPALRDDIVADLLKATGRWALLLRLTNRLVSKVVATGVDPSDAASQALRRLRELGPSAVDDPSGDLDLDDPKRRNEAVRATVRAATTLLPEGGAERFAELGVFNEDEAFPVGLVAKLWQATGELDEDRSRQLCMDLEGLSLLSLDPRDGGRITLHDVLRDYLRAELGETRVASLHARLVDSAAASLDTASPLAPGAPDPGRAWWELTEGYLLDHLVEHLLAAGRAEQAEAVASDLRWVEARLAQRGPTAPWSDLLHVPTDASTERARSIAQAAHLLTDQPAQVLTSTLFSRLEPSPYWHDQVLARQDDTARRPLLVNRWPPPDLPDPALLRTLTGHTDRALSVAVSSDGTWLATTSTDETVRLWDAASGTCTGALVGHTDMVLSVAISPDGTWLATASGNWNARVWDAATTSCTAELEHGGPVSSVAISPDGTWLATTSTDGTIRIWDQATASRTARLTGHRGPVTSVAIAPDGTWFASTGADRTVRIWDRATDKCTATLSGHDGTVTSVVIAPDGTWFATTGADRTVRIWDRATGACSMTFTDHPVRSVAVSPDGTWLAAASDDRAVRIWDLTTGTCTRTLTDLTSWVESLAVFPDGTRLVTTGSDGTVRIWDPAAGTGTATPSDRSEPVTAVAFSSDGSLTTTCANGTLRTWDPATGDCDAIELADGPEPDSWAISPDGTRIATITGSLVSVADQIAGTSTTIAGHNGPVTAVAFSPDGKWIATTGQDRTLRVWDALTSLQVDLLRTDGALFTCAWAPDSRGLAAGGDRGVYVYELLP